MDEYRIGGTSGRETPDITVELNGVANIKFLVNEMLFICAENEGPIEAINNQLDILERYLVEIANAVREDRANAAWHEVRMDPSSFPKNDGSR
jgi:hypothetical protein